MRNTSHIIWACPTYVFSRSPMKTRLGSKFDNLPEYKYMALEPGYNSRLVEIQPGSPKDALRISIVQTRFDVAYEALSWCWGSECETAPVVVEEARSKYELKFRSKSTLYVKPTLEKAMHSLRLKKDIRRIWIDAVCINQHDDTEKSIQVRNMANIYRQARSVCIWLPVENAADTAKMIKGTRTSKTLQKLMRYREAGRSDISDLLRSPWFGRRWIVPEVSLAPQATMVLGSDQEVDWDSFARFFILLLEYYESNHDRPTSDMDSTVETDTLVFYNSPSHKLVELVSNLRIASDPAKSLPAHVLEDVLCLCADFRCQRGQDIIYALLPLGSDVHTSSPGQASGDSDTEPTMHSFTVDYTRTTLEVYQDFVQFAVRSALGRTDVILRHWAPLDIGDLDYGQETPYLSWLRPPPPTGRDGDHRTVRQRELTGTAENPLFFAAGTPEHWATPDRDSLFPINGRLRIESLILDTITSTLRSNTETISRAWPIYAGWLDTTQPPPDHFWQTLVAGLDFNNKPLSGSASSTNRKQNNTLRTACHDAFRLYGPDFRLYSSFVSEVVLFELKRVFWPGTDDDSHMANSPMALRERWRHLNLPLRHPDQQLRIVQVLRRIAADGFVGLPFLQSAEVADFSPLRYPLSSTAQRFLREEVLQAIDMEAMLEAARYRRLVHATTLGRSLFRSGSEIMELFGLVPSEAVVGDLICIIRGCSVPVVLRRLPPREDSDDDGYTIVGEAYVYGLMNGEALALNRPWRGIEIW
ncbi:heterokaryon incompatibility protein-domain-containing protein [Apodospora peruviana]|uniref:Heterokaryon incompatibility protein-domain-containing protein n=1 Tax=Apodospora peruviana TaxID=516989 RepID=A0AAE0M190_9PEZI|nr:heterokaryon incompatibility protein-domain-containing protein [Apodospora peruviana]